MSDELWFLKERLRDDSGYHLDVPPCRIKVNQNENPYDLPLDLKRRIAARFAEEAWGRYPPFVPERFHRILGDHYGFPGDRVVSGNGSNEVLYATLAVTLDPGDTVIIPVPTFSLYAILARLFGARVVFVPLRDDLTLDPAVVVRAAREHRAKVTILCSPNNPTGIQYPEGAVEEILEGNPGLTILDEAYVEFAPMCLTGLLHRHRRLVVLRTFSKALALAGLRIGCALARPELASRIAKGKLPYSLNAFTTRAVEILLTEEPGALAPSLARIREDRDRLAGWLRDLPGVRPYPSQANFVLARFPRPAPAVFADLVAREILVRDVSGYPALADHLRISVGTTAEMEEVHRALLDLLEKPL